LHGGQWSDRRRTCAADRVAGLVRRLAVAMEIAAIMVLPVLLAAMFGALRIQNELSAASKLSVASGDAGIVVPCGRLRRSARQSRVRRHLGCLGCLHPGTPHTVRREREGTGVPDHLRGVRPDSRCVTARDTPRLPAVHQLQTAQTETLPNMVPATLTWASTAPTTDTLANTARTTAHPRAKLAADRRFRVDRVIRSRTGGVRRRYL
jgi:hypothetical protein